MKSFGHRGDELESIINRTIDNYRINKLALIQKIPTPITPVKQNSEGQITKAFFTKKSTVDYIGIVQEIPVCFDAKESKSEKFPIKNIHKHQFEFMKEWEEQGGVSFLLILFIETNRPYYMRFKELEKFWNRDKTYFSLKELDEKYFIKTNNILKLDFLDKLQNDIEERE